MEEASILKSANNRLNLGRKSDGFSYISPHQNQVLGSQDRHKNLNQLSHQISRFSLEDVKEEDSGNRSVESQKPVEIPPDCILLHLTLNESQLKGNKVVSKFINKKSTVKILYEMVHDWLTKDFELSPNQFKVFVLYNNSILK